MSTGSKRERSPGTWELRVSLGRDPLTKTPRYATRTVHTTSIRQADRLLAEFVTEIGKTNRRAAPAKGPKTVADLMAAWLDHICDGLTVEEMAANPDKAAISPQTAYVYRGIVNRRIVPRLGHLRLAKLTTYEVDAFYREMLRGSADSEPLAKSTARKVANVLTKALDQAVTWGFLTVNPAREAKKPVPGKPVITSPGPDVVVRLIDGAERVGNDGLATFIFAAADSGARRGELCALRWSDINWLTGHAQISHAIGAVPGVDPFEKDTKTHQERLVTFNAGTLVVLKRWREQLEDRADRGGAMLSPDAYLFPAVGSLDGLTPTRPDLISKRFERLCEAEGIKGVTVHRLRHFCGTELEAAGIPVSVISARLGHSRTSTTMDMYVHARAEGDGLAAGIMRGLLAPEREKTALPKKGGLSVRPEPIAEPDSSGGSTAQ